MTANDIVFYSKNVAPCYIFFSDSVEIKSVMDLYDFNIFKNDLRIMIGVLEFYKKCAMR